MCGHIPNILNDTDLTDFYEMGCMFISTLFNTSQKISRI